MDRESISRFHEHEIERTLPAWYSCRLNPKYRKDWADNRHMVDWLRNRINDFTDKDRLGLETFLREARYWWAGILFKAFR